MLLRVFCSHAPLNWRDLHYLNLFSIQYADPVSDLLDKYNAFSARLFRESCVFHRGNYVKVHKVPFEFPFIS